MNPLKGEPGDQNILRKFENMMDVGAELMEFKLIWLHFETPDQIQQRMVKRWERRIRDYIVKYGHTERGLRRADEATNLIAENTNFITSNRTMFEITIKAIHKHRKR